MPVATRSQNSTQAAPALNAALTPAPTALDVKRTIDDWNARSANAEIVLTVDTQLFNGGRRYGSLNMSSDYWRLQKVQYFTPDYSAAVHYANHYSSTGNGAMVLEAHVYDTMHLWNVGKRPIVAAFLLWLRRDSKKTQANIERIEEATFLTYGVELTSRDKLAKRDTLSQLRKWKVYITVDDSSPDFELFKGPNAVRDTIEKIGQGKYIKKLMRGVDKDVCVRTSLFLEDAAVHEAMADWAVATDKNGVGSAELPCWNSVIDPQTFHAEVILTGANTAKAAAVSDMQIVDIGAVQEDDIEAVAKRGRIKAAAKRDKMLLKKCNLVLGKGGDASTLLDQLALILKDRDAEEEVVLGFGGDV